MIEQGEGEWKRVVNKEIDLCVMVQTVGAEGSGKRAEPEAKYALLLIRRYHAHPQLDTHTCTHTHTHTHAHAHAHTTNTHI